MTDKNIDLKAIGLRIRREREMLNLSREKFSEIIGLSDYYIGQLERGERQMSLSVLVNISKFLRVPLDYLVFGANIYSNSYLKEGFDKYNTQDTNQNNVNLQEINDLLIKCSSTEQEMFYQIIRTIIPYIYKK